MFPCSLIEVMVKNKVAILEPVQVVSVRASSFLRCCIGGPLYASQSKTPNTKIIVLWGEIQRGPFLNYSSQNRSGPKTTLIFFQANISSCITRTSLLHVHGSMLVRFDIRLVSGDQTYSENSRLDTFATILRDLVEFG